MRIAYFPKSVARNGSAILSAFLQGCHRHGIDTVENSLDADAAVIWSVLWHGRMQPNQQIYQHYRNLGRPVVIIDVGTLHRNVTWKIAVNNITAQGYYGHLQNLDPDRPRKLGVALRSDSCGDQIVVAAQHSRSLQVAELINVEHWIEQQIQHLRQYTDRPITVRPHPRSALDRSRIEKLGVSVSVPARIPSTYDSYDLKFDCYAMVNYNSGPGILSALAGTRTIVDRTSLAHPVSIDGSAIEKSCSVDRDQWLVEICHTEYTQQEIQQGIWLPRLQPALLL